MSLDSWGSSVLHSINDLSFCQRVNTMCSKGVRKYSIRTESHYCITLGTLPVAAVPALLSFAALMSMTSGSTLITHDHDTFAIEVPEKIIKNEEIW